jgi:hypothetical protein
LIRKSEHEKNKDIQRGHTYLLSQLTLGSNFANLELRDESRHESLISEDKSLDEIEEIKEELEQDEESKEVIEKSN